MGHDDVLALPEDELSGGALRLVHRVRVLQGLQGPSAAEAVPLVSVVLAVLAERAALCPLFDPARDLFAEAHCTRPGSAGAADETINSAKLAPAPLILVLSALILSAWLPQGACRAGFHEQLTRRVKSQR